MHHNRTIIGLTVLGLFAGLLGSGMAADGQGDLPRVLIIGDSISIGYTDKVAELLAGEAVVERPMGEDGKAENCGPTSKGIADLDLWLGDARWDVIHFNWGLHDLCYRHPDSTATGHRDKVNGTITVTPEQYEANLRQLVARLKATGANLIWASTTPVPEGTLGRFVGDEVTYKEIAARVMAENNIPIDDLYAYMLPEVAKYGRAPGEVHYTDEGSDYLAVKVAAAIKSGLEGESTP